FDFARIRNARGLTKATRERFRKLDFAGLRFHDLRVTHATALLDAGVPVHTVAQRIGNRPDILLRRYAKRASAADERTKGVLATLARSLGQTINPPLAPPLNGLEPCLGAAKSLMQLRQRVMRVSKSARRGDIRADRRTDAGWMGAHAPITALRPE